MNVEMQSNNKRIVKVFIIVTILVSIMICFDDQKQMDTMYGDMSVYISQSMSIAYDFDNLFEQKDLDRFFREVSMDGPACLFLNEHNGAYYYSKPMLYALCMAPLVLLLGVKGILVGNWILFVLIMYMLYSYLKNYNKIWISILVPMLLFVLSFALPYIFVAHIDLFLAFLLCLILFSYHKYIYAEEKNAKRWLIITAIVIGISVYQRTPFVFFAMTIWLKLIYDKRNKDAWKLFFVALVPFVFLSGIQILQTGSYTCYNGIRYYVPGFSDGLKSDINNLELFRIGFNDKVIIQRVINSFTHPKALIMNLVYYFIGRQTGIFIYSPFIICTILLMFNRKLIKDKWYLILAFILYIMFFFMEDPTNYFGGGQSLGNRYYLQIMPLAIFMLKEIPLKRYFAGVLVASIIASVFLGPVIFGPKYWLRDKDAFISRKVMQILPLEWTLFPSIRETAPRERVIETKNECILLQNFYQVESDGGVWTKGGEVGSWYIQSTKPITSIDIKTVYWGGEELFNVVLENQLFLLDKYYYKVDFDFLDVFYPQDVMESIDTRKLGRRLSIKSINYN